MQGKFEEANKEYEWWAGKASAEADSEYCVHCRCGDYGVTRYMDSEPGEADAERTARALSLDLGNLH